MIKLFKKLLKLIAILGTVVLILLIAGWWYFNNVISIDIPEGNNMAILKTERVEVSENFYTLGNNWLRKNKQGIWEMYLEGDGFERGVAHGKLAKEMVVNQEDNFVGQIKQMIPSDIYLNFLKYFILWFNRDIDDYIPAEFKNEIYGVSFSFSENYNFIGSNYERILNYHAAHDIGHALQDKNMVPGCTAFSAWDGRAKDSSMIIGRNFDFFVGEGFAEDKIVCFINPDSGYKLMFVTWGGFTGVVSGMNEKGLTVTLNASKSDIPTGAAMPISLLAREILQYASNSQEAYAIAQKRKTFVSEAIMIGSAIEDKTFIIEKSPTKIGLYEATGSEILCSNHFQGKTFQSEEDEKERSSLYRYKRLQELLIQYDYLDEFAVAKILRDQKGLGNKDIGMGNEKALNQLIAHHSIIFRPLQKLVWVSANPFQLGTYVAYDIEKVFQNNIGIKEDKTIALEQRNIPADSFLVSEDYQQFLKYKEYKTAFAFAKKVGTKFRGRLPSVKDFIATNPEFYNTYWVVGDYMRFNQKDFASAIKYYELALTKEVPRDNEVDALKDAIKDCEDKMKLK